SVVGIGQAGVVALCAAALLEHQVASMATVGSPASYVTNHAYPAGTSMGTLAPGILQVGDVSHLAAVSAPRPVLVRQGLSAQAQLLSANQLQAAFSFTRAIYRLHKAENRFRETATGQAKEIAAWISHANAKR